MSGRPELKNATSKLLAANAALNVALSYEKQAAFNVIGRIPANAEALQDPAVSGDPVRAGVAAAS